MFFKCSFSNRIWKYIMALCLVSFARVGNKEPQRQKFESHSLQNLMVGYSVSLWLQRNTRLYAEEVQSEEQIIKAFEEMLRPKWKLSRHLLLFSIKLFVTIGIPSYVHVQPSFLFYWFSLGWLVMCFVHLFGEFCIVYLCIFCSLSIFNK